MSTHFISYARRDSEFAWPLAQKLREAGIDIWIDQRLTPGDRWDREVEDALRASEVFIVLLSPESVQSIPVGDEVSLALEEHKKIIPILIQACKKPMRLGRFQHIDFTQDYDSAFRQLLTALGITPPKADTDEELQLWLSARKKHSITAYQEYLRKYAAGRYTQEAGAFLLQLKEEKKEKTLWQETIKEDTVAAYEYYLAESSLMIHRREALEKTKTATKPAQAIPFKTIGIIVALAGILLSVWEPWSARKTATNNFLPILYLQDSAAVVIPEPPLLQGLHVRNSLQPFFVQIGKKPALGGTEDWFRENKLAINFYNNSDLPAPKTIPRSYKGYQLTGGGKSPDGHIFWYGTGFDQVRYLLITNVGADSVQHFLDFSRFIVAGGPCQGGIRWTELHGDSLFISQYSRCTTGELDYRISAISLSGNKILWTSPNHTCNAAQFLVSDKYIISSYGNDSNDNKLYLLSRSKGNIAGIYPFSGQIQFIGSNDDLYYIRTASADLTYTIGGGARPLNTSGARDCEICIDWESYKRLYNSIQRTPQEERLNKFLNALQKNCFRTDMTREIVDLLHSDSVKFEAIKNAYPRTTDHAKFPELKESLSTAEWKNLFSSKFLRK